MASPDPALSRREWRDEAEIVIVRERRFKYRWSYSQMSGGRRTHTGVAWTCWGARRCALRCAHSILSGTFIGRVEREEMRLVAQMSTAPTQDPERLPTELLR